MSSKSNFIRLVGLKVYRHNENEEGIRPVQCNHCGHFEYIKMASGNNLASYKCNFCRNGRPANPISVMDMQSSRTIKVVSVPRSSHDRKK